MYKKKKKVPPCAECVPELMAGNYDAAKIYLLCRYQQYVVPGGFTDINFGVILKVIDLYDIKNKRECFELVVMVYREIISQGGDE